ncbi:MAG: helicase-related protein [Bacteroidota bacterium]|nr:helicase-related protein [Bacteroidota bacterium]
MRLLWQAARLTLREGAAPLRSLGRISIRPRVYQFVPLLMALRLQPVRLFIADDVGVGKTIEALLIARELLDRGEIRRLCVLCPPYLCEQWASELAQKFNLEPVVIRSGTVSQLERLAPAGKSIYEYFPVQVASIDFVKTDRNRHLFLQFCPELVIVDEVHGAAAAQGRLQQERHALLKELAKDPNRHLILLTATPHSGIEEAFRSLLALLDPRFGQWNIAELTDEQRAELARHFVQRTRADILQDWESAPPFPKREATDATYELSGPYLELFRHTYDFCSELVQTGQRLDERRRRVRYWGALALLRCVMSSPKAAIAALTNRIGLPTEGEDSPDLAFRPFVFESAEDYTEDESPTPPVEATETTLPESDQRRLRELALLAEQLCGPKHDAKLRRAAELVQGPLSEGFHPILWCRYVATAEYVAEHLRSVLPPEVQVLCITGRMSDDERQSRIRELDPDRPRVLVATDCLSEGVNLQEYFTAVIHYDLPWNPNRLEQREGRVDRYGQPAKVVRVVRFFGSNNPIDGVVIRVLLDKAAEIRRALGTYVPVPEESQSVMEAVLQALFFRHGLRSEQLALELELPDVSELHRRWESDAERERLNRTRFAQRALKPQEVQRELEATDAVLGDPKAVREFVLAAAQRLGLPISQDPRRPNVWRIPLSPDALRNLPEAIRYALPRHSQRHWLISFDSPTPEGAEYVGRNHRFVAALARFLLEQALAQPGHAIASRCGAIRTRAVQELTTLLLLRVRYLLQRPDAPPLLLEEVLVLGYVGDPQYGLRWLNSSTALRLLEAQPDANLPLSEKRELIERALHHWADWQASDLVWSQSSGPYAELRTKLNERAQYLEQAYKRIRQAVNLRVRGLSIHPQLPPDLLGVLVLQLMVEP